MLERDPAPFENSSSQSARNPSAMNVFATGRLAGMAVRLERRHDRVDVLGTSARTDPRIRRPTPARLAQAAPAGGSRGDRSVASR